METSASGTSTDTSRLTPTSAGKKQILVALFASVAGWSLDIFDLFLLLFVAPTIGPLFFPAENPVLSLAGVYAGFAISGIVRPLGGVLFGSLADKRGRKKALFLTMGGVGLITALMGALPTVSQIGPLAAGLFLALRALQGVFIGGINASTHTIGTETVPPSWRGWVAGLIQGSGGGIAIALASGVYGIMSSLFPGPLFAIWGWRCMFFTGLLSAVFALFIFYTLNESPYFVALQKKKAVVSKPPIKVLFASEYRRITLWNLAIVTAAASMYYLTAGYLPTFLDVINHLPKPVAAEILSWTGVVGAISCIIVGQLSQWFGRKPAYLVMSILGMALALFGVPFLAGSVDLRTITVVSLLFAAFANAQPTLIFLNERYPTVIRATGTSVCWNVGFAVGGMMPMVVTGVAPSVAKIPVSLTWFLLGMSVLLFISTMFVKETKGNFQ
ncbi:MAG: MFS transporter [Desulfomonilaceae bacterium]